MGRWRLLRLFAAWLSEEQRSGSRRNICAVHLNYYKLLQNEPITERANYCKTYKSWCQSAVPDWLQLSARTNSMFHSFHQVPARDPSRGSERSQLKVIQLDVEEDRLGCLRALSMDPNSNEDSAATTIITLLRRARRRLRRSLDDTLAAHWHSCSGTPIQVKHFKLYTRGCTKRALFIWHVTR